MEYTVRKITQIDKVFDSERKNIYESVNDRLRQLSHLHEMQVVGIEYDHSESPDIRSSATILYSYTGVIDELYHHFSEILKNGDIPITESSTLVIKDQLPPFSEKRVTIRDAIINGYKFKKGDIIII